ncbi:response regulator transcription factor [Promicromonospora sp. NPDC019610]|uniref:response regulator transcription factor n=1 Tax=Promicromonospora sp. NPDC019610 TaxID=3364405 RepID=UPI0037874510
MTKVLVVDDDALVTLSVAAHLTQAGHVARTATDAAEGERMWRSWQPDAVVLDVRLPGSSGLEMLTRRRRDGDATPVLMLSGLSEVDDRVVGLEQGADDYVTKPFDARELVLRVEALLRRGPFDVQHTPVRVRAGGLVLDEAARTASYRGRVVELTPREFALLSFLAQRPGHPFGRRELLRRVWGWTFGDDSTVMVHIRRLRRKLEDDPARPELIVNLRGTGYMVSAGDGVGAPPADGVVAAVPPAAAAQREALR